MRPQTSQTRWYSFPDCPSARSGAILHPSILTLFRKMKEYHPGLAVLAEIMLVLLTLLIIPLEASGADLWKSAQMKIQRQQITPFISGTLALQSPETIWC